MSLLDKNPITNEPGWEKYTLEYPQALDYAEWIEYKLLEMVVSEYGQFKLKTNPSWELFRDVLETAFPERWNRIRDRIIKKAETIGKKAYKGIPYSMAGTANWNALLERLTKIDSII